MPSVSKKRHNAGPYDKIFRQVPDVFFKEKEKSFCYLFLVFQLTAE